MSSDCRQLSSLSYDFQCSCNYAFDHVLKFYLLKFQLFALVLQHGGVEVSTVGRGLSVCSLHVHTRYSPKG